MQKLKPAQATKVLRTGPVVKLATLIGDEDKADFEETLTHHTFDAKWAAKCKKAGSLMRARVRSGEIVLENDEVVPMDGRDIETATLKGATLIALSEKAKGSLVATRRTTYIVVPDHVAEDGAENEEKIPKASSDEDAGDAPSTEPDRAEAKS